MLVAGGVSGLALSYLRLRPYINNNFNWFEYTKHVPIQLYEASRTARAIGFFGLIMLLFKSGRIKRFFKLMQPVGQMAFTNYLMQSLVCCLLFNGIGFGLYGSFSRSELYCIAIIIWILQIVYSHAWLRYFRFGPFEWLWKSLTYWKSQPLRR